MRNGEIFKERIMMIKKKFFALFFLSKIPVLYYLVTLLKDCNAEGMLSAGILKNATFNPSECFLCQSQLFGCINTFNRNL
jgi:hypothetical protein